MKNVIIFILASMLFVLLYKYHVVHDNLSIIKNKINTEDMTLFKESDVRYSIISKDNRLIVLFTYNSYGINSFSVLDELSDKQISFNFSEEGELLCYQYKDNNYTAATNVYFQPYRDRFVERYESLNGYETIYEFFEGGMAKVTAQDALPK